MLINLWVKDKTDGRIHQVGTEVHDSVEYLNGEVVFVNMQSMSSTLDDYEWVEPPDTDDYISVTPDELKVNRELIHKDLMKKLEEKKLKFIEPEDSCISKKDMFGTPVINQDLFVRPIDIIE